MLKTRNSLYNFLCLLPCLCFSFSHLPASSVTATGTEVALVNWGERVFVCFKYVTGCNSQVQPNKQPVQVLWLAMDLPSNLHVLSAFYFPLVLTAVHLYLSSAYVLKTFSQYVPSSTSYKIMLPIQKKWHSRVMQAEPRWQQHRAAQSSPQAKQASLEGQSRHVWSGWLSLVQRPYRVCTQTAEH